MFNKVLNCHKYIALTCSMLLLTSCSVFMAANKQGVSLEELSTCHTRECLLSKGATSVSSEKNKNGVLTSEVFQARKPTGSATRAVMHGVLDVSTFGIWEAVGTPIEGTLDKKEMYVFNVVYKNKGSDIKAVQLGR
jgi:hypothetical protein